MSIFNSILYILTTLTACSMRFQGIKRYRFSQNMFTTSGLLQTTAEINLVANDEQDQPKKRSQYLLFSINCPRIQSTFLMLMIERLLSY